jgi:hypothetical protein
VSAADALIQVRSIGCIHNDAAIVGFANGRGHSIQSRQTKKGTAGKLSPVHIAEASLESVPANAALFADFYCGVPFHMDELSLAKTRSASIVLCFL